MNSKILVVIIIIFAVGVLISILNKPRQDNLSKISIGSQELRVEIADTPEKITQGLSDRESIGSDGLLFVMPSRAIPSFWMKDMRFDLDFIWIDGNTVADITENVSHQEGASLSELKVYSPNVPVTHVLEMNAGEIEKRGIKVGDTVSL